MKLAMLTPKIEPQETLYGSRKRFRALFDLTSVAKKETSPLHIIELGCGTGEGLLIPLAQNFSEEVILTGLDTDIESINHAQHRADQLNLKSLQFKVTKSGALPDHVSLSAWDIVIVSEVFEHIENPQTFLKTCYALLQPRGKLFFTVPNGYGPFEWESFLWKAFRLDILVGLLKKLLRFKTSSPGQAFTLNQQSKHVGFYKNKNIVDMLILSGFKIELNQNTSWFCGEFSDKILKLFRLIKLEKALIMISVSVAKYLPSCMVSDWIIIAMKDEPLKDSPFPKIPDGWFEEWWWKAKRRQNTK